MKRISKTESGVFKQYLSKNKPETWGHVSNAIGNELRKYMLEKEQNHQCAYTEVHIKSEDSHIDHFQKQHLFPELRFDWNNLLTSCNSEYYGAKFKDKTVKKSDYKFLINPAKINPQEHLRYSLTGEIVAKNKFGEITIGLFNLNDKSLVEQRKSISKQMKSLCKNFKVDEIVKQYGKFESFIREIFDFYRANED